MFPNPSKLLNTPSQRSHWESIKAEMKSSLKDHHLKTSFLEKQEAGCRKIQLINVPSSKKWLPRERLVADNHMIVTKPPREVISEHRAQMRGKEAQHVQGLCAASGQRGALLCFHRHTGIQCSATRSGKSPHMTSQFTVYPSDKKPLICYTLRFNNPRCLRPRRFMAENKD